MESTGGPVHLTDAEFDAVVKSSEVPVVVDFWAAWCGPCRMIAPHIEELAREYGPKVLVAKVDTDANPATPIKFGIMGIPTMIFFKGGQEVDRMVGVPRQPREVLRAKVDAVLTAPVPAN